MNTKKYDIIIIGGGPIGLACGLEAQKAGLSYLILEKGCLVNSLYNYPANIRVRLHAPRTGGVRGAGLELRADRHAAGAASHELGGRRHRARAAARRGAGLRDVRLLAVGDERGRLRRGGGRGRAGRAGGAPDAAARGRQLRRVLPDRAGRRRDDHLDARQQRRPHARAVRHRAGGG